MRQRYFTPEEASNLLPTILDRLARLRALAAELRVLADEIREMFGTDLDEDEVASRALNFRKKRLEADALLGSVRQEGVDLKGLEPILLDFPALRMGKEVYLCWREGDGELAWWHPIETGIKGRRPLAADDPGIWEWVN